MCGPACNRTFYVQSGSVMTNLEHANELCCALVQVQVAAQQRDKPLTPEELDQVLLQARLVPLHFASDIDLGRGRRVMTPWTPSLKKALQWRSEVQAKLPTATTKLIAAMKEKMQKQAKQDRRADKSHLSSLFKAELRLGSWLAGRRNCDQGTCHALGWLAGWQGGWLAGWLSPIEA